MSSKYTITDAGTALGDFSLTLIAGQQETDEEALYRRNLKTAFDSLAKEDRADNADTDLSHKPLIDQKSEFRRAAVAELRREAEAFVGGTLSAGTAAWNVGVIKGKCNRSQQTLEEKLFLVSFQQDNGGHPGPLATNLQILVNTNLPPPLDKPGPEKQALYVALLATDGVIKAVAHRMRHRKVRSSLLVDRYVRKLVEIGRLGLQGNQVELANRSLDALRAEFVAQTAGYVKNSYLFLLSIAAGLTATLMIGAYAHVVYFTPPASGFWWNHRSFLLAAGGAAIGTWVSFAIRGLGLTFDDLGGLESGFLDSIFRIVFVVILTMTVCLLFWTGATNIEVGDLKTAGLRGADMSVPAGAVAVLIGLFCGISERSLATAISGKAAAFIKGVAGGT